VSALTPRAPGERPRRTDTRLDVAVPVLLEWAGMKGRGVVRNISSGGAFIQTAHKLPLGSCLRVVFGGQDGGEEMSAYGEVKHQICLNYGRSPSALLGIGVRFAHFDSLRGGGLLDA